MAARIKNNHALHLVDRHMLAKFDVFSFDNNRDLCVHTDKNGLKDFTVESKQAYRVCGLCYDFCCLFANIFST